MKTFMKLLSMILAVAMIAIVPAMAEEGEVPSGEETITFDNGVTVTYDKNDFKVDCDEDGNIGCVYLGEIPEYAGFDIVDAKGVDAEAYITEAAESYGLEVEHTSLFNESTDWVGFYQEVEDTDYVTTRTVYARNNDTGCWILTLYGFYPNTEDFTEDDVISTIRTEMVVDSLTFAR